MRGKCVSCCIKHLSQVLILDEELINYPKYKFRMIGHLAEAEEECNDLGLRAEIRTLRLHLLEGEALEVEKLEIILEELGKRLYLKALD